MTGRNFLSMLLASTAAVTGAEGVTVTVQQDTIQDIQWRIGPNLPEFRKGGCATALGGKLISVFGMRQPWGEMATAYVYDATADDWSRVTDAPVGQCYVQGTELGDTFYAIGGRGALQQGQVHPACYRLQEDGAAYTWTRIQDLNESRGWAPSVSVGSKLYVFGGAQGGHGPCVGGVEMLDTADPDAQWQVVSSLPGLSRGWLGAAAAAGKIYVFGGAHFIEPEPPEGPDRIWYRDLHEFDPVTSTWTAKTSLPYRTSGMDSCVYADRYIIVVGGWVAIADYDEELMQLYEGSPRHTSYYCPFVQVYDTQTDTWTRMPTLLPFSCNDIRVVLIGHTLYAVGGENIEPATSNTTPWLRIGEIVK